MAVCRFSDYQCKEVVNVCDGGRLGFVRDVEVDLPGGQICAIYVPGPFCWRRLLSPCGSYRIPWSCIRQIGSDIILVEAELSACRTCRPPRRRRKT